MRYFYVLIVCMLSVSTAAETKRVKVHMDPGNNSEGCPLYVREIGRPARCKQNPAGKFESDAVCMDATDRIEWTATGNASITISAKPGMSLPFTNCSPTNMSGTTVTCHLNVTAGSHAYAISTGTCILDPRIIINSARATDV